MTPPIKNIHDLREYHDQKRVAHEKGGSLKALLYAQIVTVIDAMRKGHDEIVRTLIDRLARSDAALRLATQSMHDQSADHFTIIESMQARHAVLQERHAVLAEELAATNTGKVTITHDVEIQGNLIVDQKGWREPARATAARRDAMRKGNPRPTAAPSCVNAPHLDAVAAFLAAVLSECDRARAKHPGTDAMCNALTEEVGEVAKALADEPASHVYTECVQVASTAMRIALEGDRAVDVVRSRHGLDPLPGAPHVSAK